MRHSTVTTVSFFVLVLAIAAGNETDSTSLVLQSILCGTSAVSAIIMLRRYTENHILAGALFASVAALALLIAAPLFGGVRSFEIFLVHELGIALGAAAMAFAIDHLPGRGKWERNENG